MSNKTVEELKPGFRRIQKTGTQGIHVVSPFDFKDLCMLL